MTGWYGRIEEICDQNRTTWLEAEGKEGPRAPEPKPFRKRFPEVQTRKSYKGTFEESFWDNWPKKEIPDRHETWIDKGKLQMEAKKANYGGTKLVKTLAWLEEGVELGCLGDARKQTISSNHESAFEYGERITDALRGWIEDGICAGPYKKEELEEMGFKDITINSMQVRKPTRKLIEILGAGETEAQWQGENNPRSVVTALQGREATWNPTGSQQRYRQN